MEEKESMEMMKEFDEKTDKILERMDIVNKEAQEELVDLTETVISLKVDISFKFINHIFLTHKQTERGIARKWC